jgi:hypothetical protein
MEWLLVAIMGAGIGFVVSLAVGAIRFPLPLCVAIGAFGALAGAALFHITGSEVFGILSLYIAGAVISTLALAGGLLAYMLTSPQRRA